MPESRPKPYWVDDLGRKHEWYPYEDADAQNITVEHQGRSIRVVIPPYAPPVRVRQRASSGEFLFLIGEQLSRQVEGGRIIEGGDGVLMVARRCQGEEDAYWVFVWHNLFAPALRYLEG